MKKYIYAADIDIDEETISTVNKLIIVMRKLLYFINLSELFITPSFKAQYLNVTLSSGIKTLVFHPSKVKVNVPLQQT